MARTHRFEANVNRMVRNDNNEAQHSYLAALSDAAAILEGRGRAEALRTTSDRALESGGAEGLVTAHLEQADRAIAANDHEMAAAHVEAARQALQEGLVQSGAIRPVREVIQRDERPGRRERIEATQRAARNRSAIRTVP
jgi:hypothetical protein